MPATENEHPHARWSHRPISSADFVRARFTGLTVVLMTLSFCATAINEKDLRELLVSLAFSVLLLFAVGSVGRRLRVAMLLLALPTLVGHWALPLTQAPIARIGVFAVTTVMLAFLTLVIASTVFRDQAVTADTIVGAVGAYLLIGVTWGTFYAFLTTVTPQAFSVSPALASAGSWTQPSSSFTPLLQYYSFTTLATLGYGDITPLSSGARSLSILEGLTGQLYLAVLVARLVGMHTAHRSQQ